jgi:hypothetical protein
MDFDEDHKYKGFAYIRTRPRELQKEVSDGGQPPQEPASAKKLPLITTTTTVVVVVDPHCLKVAV